MDALVLPIAASLSVLALVFSIVSMVFHWIRRREHPDVSQARTEIANLRGEMLELWDKFDHQVKRDRVRRLRASREQKEAEEQPEQPVDFTTEKAELRRRAMGLIGR